MVHLLREKNDLYISSIVFSSGTNSMCSIGSCVELQVSEPVTMMCYIYTGIPCLPDLLYVVTIIPLISMFRVSVKLRVFVNLRVFVT